MEMDVNILQLQLLVLSIAIFTASDAKKGNSIFSLTSIFEKLNKYKVCEVSVDFKNFGYVRRLFGWDAEKNVHRSH